MTSTYPVHEAARQNRYIVGSTSHYYHLFCIFCTCSLHEFRDESHLDMKRVALYDSKLVVLVQKGGCVCNATQGRKWVCNAINLISNRLIRKQRHNKDIDRPLNKRKPPHLSSSKLAALDKSSNRMLHHVLGAREVSPPCSLSECLSSLDIDTTRWYSSPVSPPAALYSRSGTLADRSRHKVPAARSLGTKRTAFRSPAPSFNLDSSCRETDATLHPPPLLWATDTSVHVERSLTRLTRAEWRFAPQNDRYTPPDHCVHRPPPAACRPPLPTPGACVGRKKCEGLLVTVGLTMPEGATI